jgi:hypothetical protein
MTNGSQVFRISREYADLLQREHVSYCQRKQKSVSLIEFTRTLARTNFLTGGPKEKKTRLF